LYYSDLIIDLLFENILKIYFFKEILIKLYQKKIQKQNKKFNFKK
jgi:hypothetical protein